MHPRAHIHHNIFFRSPNPKMAEAELALFLESARSRVGELVTMDELYNCIYRFGVKSLLSAIENSKSLPRQVFVNLMAIMQFFKRNTTTLGFGVYKHGQIVFSRVVQTFLEFQADEVASNIHHAASFSVAWTNTELVVRWLTRLFSDFDPGVSASLAMLRQGNIENTVPLRVRAYVSFKEVVYEPCKAAIVQNMFLVMISHREKQVADCSLLQSAVAVFEKMADLDDLNRDDVFLKDFTAAFASCIIPYFQSIASAWREKMSPVEYMSAANDLLDAEKERFNLFAPQSSCIYFINALRSVFVKPHVAFMTDSLPSMLTGFTDGKLHKHQIARMYSLMAGNELVFAITEGIESIVDIFVSHIGALGKDLHQKLVNQRKDGGKVQKYDPEYISRLVYIVTLTVELVSEAFQNDVSLGRAARKSLDRVLNSDEDHAEMIAVYLDSLLRGRNGKDVVNEDEAEAACNQVLQLLSYLADKDIFREFYLLHLAKRLLLNKCMSTDVEKACIASMKVSNGPQFTHKIENMLSDFNIATSFSQEYSRLKDCSAIALTAASWPSMLRFDAVKLPAVMQRCRDDFELFWASRTNHVKILRWAWGHGSASVSLAFTPTVTKTLVGTILQCVVLLAFNTKSSFSVLELADFTNLPLSCMKRLVGSLSTVKGLSVLSKSSPGPRISDKDVVSIDDTYKNPKREVSLPVPVLEEERTGADIVTDDRKCAVDACIVRIMKSRKELSHALLVQEVVQQSRFFRPDPKLIKQRIESCISQEYLRRANPDDYTSPYVYIPGETI